MSLQAALVRWVIRRKMRPGRGAAARIFGVEGVAELESAAAVRKVREALDASVASMPGPMRGTVVERVDDGPVHGEWIIAPKVAKDTERVIFYCHGGGYFWSSLSAPRNMLARLSRLANARVFSLDFRLAPEAPMPAALEDALAAYVWLLRDQNVEAGRLTVGGGSSGGGLTLALLAALKARGLPAPGAAFLMSPWTDMTLSGNSVEVNAGYDPVISAADLHWAAGLYLAGGAAANEVASPLFAGLSGLPNMIVQIGSNEILLDDSRRLEETLGGYDGGCNLQVWPGMHHLWQLHSFFLPEGREALGNIAWFIDKTIGADGDAV